MNRNKKGHANFTGLTITGSLIRDRERLPRQNVVATLRLRIKALEERNREPVFRRSRSVGWVAMAIPSAGLGRILHKPGLRGYPAENFRQLLA